MKTTSQLIKKEQQKKWRDNNKEHTSSYFKEYREKNGDYLREMERIRYYKNRKDRILEKIIKLIHETPFSKEQYKQIICEIDTKTQNVVFI